MSGMDSVAKVLEVNNNQCEEIESMEVWDSECYP